MIPLTEQKLISQMVKQGVNTPLTSSCGRLFDAVAALIGLRGQVTYEAQAAIELEAISSRVPEEHAVYPFTVRDGQVGLRPLLGQVISDVEAGVPPGVIGQRFHQTLAEIVRSVCLSIREHEGLNAIALSGGCWQNRLLLTATVRLLQAEGFTVYTHKQVPTNDGGISLGQAAIAAVLLNQSI
jgi:hydrogenase maturation protein HypF